jgi:hypothetical protein
MSHTATMQSSHRLYLPDITVEDVLDALKYSGGSISFVRLEDQLPGRTALSLILNTMEEKGQVRFNSGWTTMDDFVITLVQ